jgi:hypothetical protein
MSVPIQPVAWQRKFFMMMMPAAGAGRGRDFIQRSKDDHGPKGPQRGY